MDRCQTPSCAVNRITRHKIRIVVRNVYKSTGFIDVDVVGMRTDCNGIPNHGELAVAVRGERLHVVAKIIHNICELVARGGWWIRRRAAAIVITATSEEHDYWEQEEESAGYVRNGR